LDTQNKLLSPDQKRKIALKRAKELKDSIKDYLEAREKIETGFKLRDKYKENKERIKKILGADETDWQDWKWQVENRVADIETLSQILNLSEERKAQINKVENSYRWAVSPYYLSLIDRKNPDCPVGKQAVPVISELIDEFGQEDPMAEEFTSPAPAVTRRYPDRLIINVTNQCAMYCRHCQRRRNIGEVDIHTPRKKLKQALDYIRANEEIRDVLLTGGDALMLSNEEIDWLLTELEEIPHVEMKRLGTRSLVTMPMRIDDGICSVLEKHNCVYVNTQFNHPREVTEASRQACLKLTKAGIPLGNQAVLLKDINNNPHVMKKLNQELLKILVRPYYIFHSKRVKGTSHFRTPVEDGLEIMEHLRGFTSGLAVPTFIINAPKGCGKTPMLPEYLVSMSTDWLYIRNWEKKIFSYLNPRS